MDIELDLLLETGGGGAGRHVLDLYCGLIERGWPVKLVLSFERADNPFRREVAERVDSSKLLTLPLHRWPHWTDVKAVAFMRKYLDATGRRHILHAHSTKAGMIGAALRGMTAGSVFTPHAYRSMDPTLSRITSIGIRTMEAGMSRRFDRIIAVSPAEVEHAISLGVPQERVIYIPNGMGAEYRRRVEYASVDYGRSPVIGFAGRLAYQKNPLLYLEVLREIHVRNGAVRGVVLGDGPLRGEMMAAAERMGLSSNIEWRGHVVAADNLADMDVLIHTSRYESFPYVLLEAAAVGVPVVAVDNAGTRAILLGKYGQAIQPDTRAMAGAAIELMQPGIARSLCLAALQAIADTFTLERMIRETAAVYEGLISGF